MPVPLSPPPRVVVLLDIDGTLLSPGGAPRRALGQALEETFGGRGGIGEVRFGGKTDRLILSEALGEAQDFEDARWGGFWERYARHLDRELSSEAPRVLAGAMELVDALLGLPDVAVGLVTGNVPAGAEIKLRHAGFRGLAARGFAVGAHAHDGTTKADLGAAARRRSVEAYGEAGRSLPHVVLGDTPADVACARRAEARAVVVATGSFDRPALAREAPDAILDALAPLDRALQTLLEGSPPPRPDDGAGGT